MTDKEDQREREQLLELSKLLIAERITSEEYFQRKAELLAWDQLQELSKLLRTEAITIEEYSQRKAELLGAEKITSEEYFQRKAELLGIDEDIPDPRPPKVRGRHLKTIVGQSHQQTELLSSIRGWVMFFGILIILSIVGWLMIFS